MLWYNKNKSKEIKMAEEVKTVAKCITCDGSGLFEAELCKDCNGSGKVSEVVSKDDKKDNKAK
jgi:DnaJ-class molecular chaperone